VSAYEFDPHALVLHIPGEPDRFNDGPQLGTEFHSHYLGLVHECAHWLQLQGTSFGAFVQLVAYSQTQNVLSRLEAMDVEKRRRLIERRIRHGEPIVSSLVRAQRIDSEVENLRENWLDHEYTLRLLVQGLAPSLRVDRAMLLTFVGGVCCLAVCSTAGLQPDHDDDWAAALFRPGARGVFELATREGRLTVRGLLEGAASAQELLAFNDLNRIPLIRGIKKRVTRSRLVAKLTTPGSSYGIVFRHFLRHLGFSTEDAGRDDVLQLFALLCDLALNPIVPPAQIPQDRHFDWWEIYPPARFQAMLQEIDRPRQLVRRLTQASVESIREEVLFRAGLPLDVPRIAPHVSTISYKTFRAGFAQDGPVMEHQRYRFWVQGRLSALRRRFPWAFVSIHDAMLGGARDQVWRYKPDRCIGWFQPPIRWAYKGTKKAVLGFQHIDQAHGTDILLSAAAHEAQYALVHQHGPLRLLQYPRADREYIRRAVQASYHARFDNAAFAHW
jgi:hypothetical protein